MTTGDIEMSSQSEEPTLDPSSSPDSRPPSLTTSPPSSSSSSSETAKKRPSPSEDPDDPPSPTKKPRPTVIALKKPNVAEENLLLLDLKDEQKLAWPDIPEAFRQNGWGGRKLSLLKSRYRSLKEGTVFWEEEDVDLMHQAIFQVEREYERTKWDNVAEKMVKLGASRRFTGAACEKKLRARAEMKKKETDGEKDTGEKEIGELFGIIEVPP